MWSIPGAVVGLLAGAFAAQTAQRELEVLRELLVREHEGLVDFTAAYLERRRKAPSSRPKD